VSPLIQQLAGEGLVDDSRFAEILIRRRTGQGYGPARIRAELRQLGVDPGGIEWPEIDWESVLQQAYRRRFGERACFSPAEFSARRRFLLQRGFEPEPVHRLLTSNRPSDSFFEFASD
jgi:regulatory protein